MVTEKKAKEATERAAKAEEADLSKKDAFAELQKLVTTQQPASEHDKKLSSSNGAPKVSKTLQPLYIPFNYKDSCGKGIEEEYLSEDGHLAVDSKWQSHWCICRNVWVNLEGL